MPETETDAEFAERVRNVNRYYRPSFAETWPSDPFHLLSGRVAPFEAEWRAKQARRVDAEAEARRVAEEAERAEAERAAVAAEARRVANAPARAEIAVKLETIRNRRRVPAAFVAKLIAEERRLIAEDEALS